MRAQLRPQKVTGSLKKRKGLTLLKESQALIFSRISDPEVP